MEEFAKLYSWISSWRQNSGYGGFLHHAIHGTVNWEHASLVPSYTYEPLINSFLNLYQKTNKKEWLDKAEQSADDLINIIDGAGQFKYSGFEFAPKSGSIVHTINPLFAFMRLYQITRNSKYLKTVKDVLESVTAIFWRGDNFAGPFNMTLMTAAAIAEYGKLSGDWRLHELYGHKCFELVKNHKVGAEGEDAEGLYYRNREDHSIIFPWYNSVKASAMIRYGNATGQEEWVVEGISLLKKIKTLFRYDYALPHSFQPDESGRFYAVNAPVLIAPVAYTIAIMQQNGVMSANEVKVAIQSILSKQTAIGFIPSNEGYDWRSMVGVTAWNCFVLELLSLNDVLDSSKTVKLDDFIEQCLDVDIRETESELSFFYKKKPLVVIDKKTGRIDKNEILNEDFRVDEKYVCEAIHLVKLNKQRHYAVSYIDDTGKGIWLESYSGREYSWSPYSVFETSGDGKIFLISKQKYDKYSCVLAKLLKPLLYHPSIVNFVLGKLKH